MEMAEWEPLAPSKGLPLPKKIADFLPWDGYWPWYKLPTETPTEPVAPTEPVEPGEIPVGTFTITAAVSGSGGTVSPATLTVDAGDSATITISPDSGYVIDMITDNGQGATIVSPDFYHLSNVTADHAVVVTFAKTVTLSGLTVAPSGGTTQVTVGGGLQFSAEVKQNEETVDVSYDVFTAWKSSNPSVATISSSGSLYAITPGTTVISATYSKGTNNLTSNQITITVVAAAPTTGNGSLKGTVTDAGTGKPISGVTVEVTETNFSAATGTDGSYSIPSIPVGSYRVNFTQTGYLMFTVVKAITTGQNTLNAAMTKIVVPQTSNWSAGQTVYWHNDSGVFAFTITSVSTVNFYGNPMNRYDGNISTIINGVTYPGLKSDRVPYASNPVSFMEFVLIMVGASTVSPGGYSTAY